MLKYIADAWCFILHGMSQARHIAEVKRIAETCGICIVVHTKQPFLPCIVIYFSCCGDTDID